jgi:hypothetical protein
VLNVRVAYLRGGNKRAQRSISTAGGLSAEWTCKYRTLEAPWSLNLRVSYLGGGDKRAKRCTSAAGEPSTEWA